MNDPIFIDEEQTDQGIDEDIARQNITHISILINECKYTVMRNLDNITKRLITDAKNNVSNNLNLKSYKDYLD